MTYPVKIISDFLIKSPIKIHLKRLERLSLTASSLLSHAKLSLTSLGRNTSGNARVKNKIKAVDRLLKNRYLQGERLSIYQAIAAKLIGQLNKIDVIVDWSPVNRRTYYILRASLALEQRSVTLYEEVHPEKNLGVYEVHKSFLNNLKAVIPLHVMPTVITDGGFRTEWFELILLQGWHFEGRVCNNMLYQQASENNWRKTSDLKPAKFNKPAYIGSVILTKARHLPCQMYSYLGKPKNNINGIALRKKGRKRNSVRSNNRYRNQQTQPWILVTSIQHEKGVDAKNIVKRYARRMKIEHEFRTTKNVNWGLGLNQTLSRDKFRLEILLLIATIAIFCLWLIGLASERRGLQYHYQANTIKTRRVLSLIFLGLQVIKHQPNLITSYELISTLRLVQKDEENTYV